MSEPTQRKSAIVQGEVASATARGHAPTVLISTAFWLYWLDIAIDQLQTAMEARAPGSYERDSGTSVGSTLTAETRAGLVACVASAASVESFYKTVAELVGFTFEREGRPAKQAFQVLRHSFAIQLHDTDLERRLRQLFDDRNRAVHSPETDAPPMRHPAGVSTGEDHVAFAVERTTERVALAANLLRACVENVRPDPEFTSLAKRMNAFRGHLRTRTERLHFMAPNTAP